ncbi:FAD-dependent oxidoreductase [Actinocorallia sp. A-T 12471]|uniref:FAD-dependent oxidoreductase n=1 Tax=Actinocorallia sp. A-T 12471 TaxID=3089813 RepID=UPI0029D066C4|nr:FAD-dependent oxidoreductase [Actinocorallia sp. A-T 12471]MDX6744970.1 FAD-dependent oxidoreductase [Actinocorallia sp. A-T 12471]
MGGTEDTTTCAIAGGGPAGMMLGLILARAGVDVVVLEKHDDFLRDFRGDTVHPSTLDVLDELGVGARFARLPQRRVSRMAVVTDAERLVVADLSRLRGRHPYIALVPQWDFLDFLAEEAARFPGFTLKMGCEVLDASGGRLRYRCAQGVDRTLRAALVVVANGRNSTLRAGFPLHEIGAPMDVAWFALPKEPDDPDELFLRVSRGRLVAMIDRGTHWQCGYVVRKGMNVDDPHVVGENVAELIPWLADRARALETTSTLRVAVNRLKRWYRPGLLCLGDAAHAMSPIGGVGINLAIQDAVAAANRLARPLRDGTLDVADLAAVQRRRMPATVLVQGFQRAAQGRLVAPTLAGAPPKLPPPRVMARLRGPLARLVAYGGRPEHVRV